MDDKLWAGREGIEGDGQADRKNHGGADKAILAYSAGHYHLWRKELNLHQLAYGAFGENFTIEGQDEDSVCIGDIYLIGEIRVQVSQPRQPCWKLAKFLNVSDLVARVQDTGRTGWYLRVLTEGFIESDLPVTLAERPYPEWTTSLASRIMLKRTENPMEDAARLASCPALSLSWKESLTAIAFDGKGKDTKDRISGPR